MEGVAHVKHKPNNLNEINAFKTELNICVIFFYFQTSTTQQAAAN